MCKQVQIYKKEHQTSEHTKVITGILLVVKEDR